MFYVYFVSPTLTMMHLCITQCTYWTPLVAGWVAGGSLESWTGREILLYLIKYRKYVRKWLLLKRNRIICSEVAVNGQIFAWKIEFFNCLKKSKFPKICRQNSIFCCKIGC